MSEAPIQVNLKLEGYQQALYTLARMWADLNVERLGWGLLASVFTLIFYVTWLVVR